METISVGDKFETLMTDFSHKKVTDITVLPTSHSC